jgi:hypothetical protein
MTDYNWHTFSDKELAAFIRNGGLTAGYDTDFNRAMVEETASRLEAAEAALAAERAAHETDVQTLRAERDEVYQQRNVAWAEERIIRQAIGADDNESTLDEVLRMRRQFEQARRDLAEYRAEIERLTKKVMTS